MRYVIVGNGPAAVGCIEAIRRKDTEGTITLFSKEPEHTYSRPLISYLLEGKTDERRMRYRGPDFYRENGVDVRLGVEATAVDPQTHTVTGSDGSTAVYDRLLLATGGRPFVPPAEGLETVAYHTFMTLADARKLEAALTRESRVLIVGAGLIGMKCLEGIRHLVREATVVDLAPQILASILDPEAAAMVQAHVEKQGVTFYLGNSVTRYAPGEALLRSGETIPFDALVMAVGVRPETTLAMSMGLDAARGIPTDERGETAIPGVYAAGDCAISHDITTGKDRVLALLPNAYMQGERCGEAMSGAEVEEVRSLPMNSMGLFGLHMITAGVLEGESHIRRENGSYKRLCTKDDRLMGYILVGDVERAGIYTSLIRDQVPLHTLDFTLMLEKPQLMAFSKRDRQIRLGGQRL